MFGVQGDNDSMRGQGRQKKILFLVTEDWYFCSHRLPLAVAALNAGYDVVVVTKLLSHRFVIESAGLRIVPLRWLRRAGLNPFFELAALIELVLIYWRERPDLVHQVALKPVIYGSIVARLLSVSSIVNALGGLGHIFSSRAFSARTLKLLLMRSFRFIFNHPRCRLILQNVDDVKLLCGLGKVEERYVRMIRGAGVSLDEYRVRLTPSGKPIVMMASRMLWTKGVGEFVRAAAALRQLGFVARFVLVGDHDPSNPESVGRTQLQRWHDSGEVEWWGYRSDMPDVISQATVVCLPTYYGEGVPKVLIEAMACARAIVTTDTPGCRDVVRSGVNGLLVEPRNVRELSSAIKELLADELRCSQMGMFGRRICESEFVLDKVVAETFSVYEELLKK